MQGTLRCLALLSTPLLCSTLFAQVSFGGRPVGLLPNGPELGIVDVAMPAVDVAGLIAEDAARQLAGEKGPYRFGFNHETDLGTTNAGVWTTLRNRDRVWRIAIQCPVAFSINFRFDRYVVPEGARVFVYNDVGETFGAFTAASSPGRTTMGVSQIPGSRITVEYHEPAAVAGQGELHIDRVTHAYRDVFNLMKDFGESGSCNINVICPQGDEWRDQIRSVAIITTGGSGFCTGALLNNCALDSTPYFLTANHCLNADVEDWVFRFNWDSPECDPTENGPIDQTVSGCTLLTSFVGTDMAFLELSSIPPADYDVFYAGWDKSGNTPDSVCGIHHPSGDIKKISLSNSTIQQSNVDFGTGAADCWQVTVWDEGTTEPGSSGSPLFNQHKLVIGQLYGGAANCANSVDDHYGRFDVSWPELEQWLGTCGDSLVGLGDSSAVVEEPIYYDAAVTSIVGIPTLICGATEIAPIVTLKNNGEVVLTAITVSYNLVGGPLYVYAWTGVLNPLQTVNVALPAIPVPYGNSTLVVSSSAPNGLQDEVITNDTWQIDFTVNTPPAYTTLIITLDNFGSDVTWTLTSDQTGTLLYEGGPYPDLEEGLEIEVPMCLTNGCYIFTILDAFGDGLCCEEGDGSYLIMDEDENIYFESTGEYEDEEVTIFCIDGVNIDEVAADLIVQLIPNPANNVVMVRSASPLDEVHLFDAVGRSVHRILDRTSSSVVIDLSGFAPGLYTVMAASNGQRSVSKLLVTR